MAVIMFPYSLKCYTKVPYGSILNVIRSYLIVKVNCNLEGHFQVTYLNSFLTTYCINELVSFDLQFKFVAILYQLICKSSLLILCKYVYNLLVCAQTIYAEVTASK